MTSNVSPGVDACVSPQLHPLLTSDRLSEPMQIYADLNRTVTIEHTGNRDVQLYGEIVCPLAGNVKSYER
jgi:hypothetical protein